jgi:uncharacterized protein
LSEPLASDAAISTPVALAIPVGALTPIATPIPLRQRAVTFLTGQPVLRQFGNAARSFKRLAQDKALRLFLLRSLLSPRVSWLWSVFIREFHRTAGVVVPEARVLAKPLRRYVHGAFGPRRRLGLLVDHYGWFARKFSDGFIRQICAGEIVPVVTLIGRKGRHYRLTIGASVTAAMQREGELAICLMRTEDGLKLSRLSLCFSSIDGRMAVIIGGVQGPFGGHKRDVIDATRDLGGLRPKDAVFLMARVMARELSLAPVHAVSDANHVLERLQNQSKFSGYDAYWRERGGLPSNEYGFAFAPIGAIEATGKKRDNVKLVIATGAETFVRARLRKGLVDRRPNERCVSTLLTAAR